MLGSIDVASVAAAALLRPQHILSFARLLLGGFVFNQLSHADTSTLVLPVVVIACLTDLADGRVARERQEVSRSGRYIDNLCDAAFLGFALSGFAIAQTWSLPVIGSAMRYSQYANWLPVLGLAVSFGIYMLRWPLEAQGRAPAGSPQGHTAGIANYLLCLLGGVAVWPGVLITPWILEPIFVTVSLLNLSAGAENLSIWLRARFTKPA